MNSDLARWDEEANIWANKILPGRQAYTRMVQEAIHEQIKDLHGLKVLDLGCGEGTDARYFREAGADVVGVDGSAKMVEFARQRHPEVKFVVSDLLEKLPFEDKSFDLITSIGVLMSLGQIDTLLTESRRVLTDSGRMIIAVFHPAFNFPTMKLVRGWRKIFGIPTVGLASNYFVSTKRRKDDKARNAWPFYHRTIEEYSQAFKRNGFLISEITEPHNLETVTAKTEYAARLPRFIIFSLVKKH